MILENVHGRGATKDQAMGVRLTEPLHARLKTFARERRFSAGEAARMFIEEGFARLDAGAPPPAGPPEPAVLDVPLLAEGVGAGRPTLRIEPGAERPYHFRRDWLVRKGWTEDDPDRFGVYRLGTDEVALSMFPTIQPESALLVDLRADRMKVEPRSIWVVRKDGGLVVKRVTVEAKQDILILESDNPDPEYAPQVVKATSAERRRILEGLVIWYATEVA